MNQQDQDTSRTRQEIIRQYLTYDLQSGTFYVLRKGLPKPLKTKEGFLSVSIQGKFYKLKANKIAWELGTGQELKEGHGILHKNTDQEDYRLSNLLELPSADISLIREAQKNLQGFLKIYPHKNDAFVYVVQWSEKGQWRKKICHDIISARKRYLRLQLRYAKILGKYLVLD